MPVLHWLAWAWLLDLCPILGCSPRLTVASRQEVLDSIVVEELMRVREPHFVNVFQDGSLGAVDYLAVLIVLVVEDDVLVQLGSREVVWAVLKHKVLELAMALVNRCHRLQHHLKPLLLVHLRHVQGLEELPPLHVEERMLLLFALDHVLPFLGQLFFGQRLDPVLLNDGLQLLLLFGAVRNHRVVYAWPGYLSVRFL